MHREKNEDPAENKPLQQCRVPGMEPGEDKSLQQYKIRRMDPADIPAAAELEAQNFSTPWSEKGFADAIKQPDNIFLVAEMGEGMIAAYCGLYASIDEGEITNVAVAESVRKKGIGSAIVHEILCRAAGQGIRKVFLEVRQSNLSARRLYEKSGFVDCGTRKNFYQRPREDAVVMCADLEELESISHCIISPETL